MYVSILMQIMYYKYMLAVNGSCSPESANNISKTNIYKSNRNKCRHMKI